MAHRSMNIPRPFFASSQKGPSLGLQIKQLQHLVKSFLLLLENIHAREVSYSQCTSERAANKGGKQKTLPSFLTITSQAPPFTTHKLLKRDRNAVLNIPTTQDVNNTLTAPVEKQFA